MSGHGTPLQISAGWESVLVANGWTSLDELFRLANDAQLAKPGLPSWRERVRCTLPHAGGAGATVYLKRFSRPPFREQFRRWLTGDPNHGTAWAEWTWLGLMRRKGLPAPEPIAYGEEMLGPWERHSAVLMAAVSGKSLEKWVGELHRRLSRPLLDAVADLVFRFHGLNLAHRDLYLAHVFCDDPEAESPRVALIDLQRARSLGWRRRRWIVKDLASLNYSTPKWAATPRDRLRWLKRYLGVSRLRMADRLLVRLIAGKTERIRRHDLRAGVTVPEANSVAPPGLGGYGA